MNGERGADDDLLDEYGLNVETTPASIARGTPSGQTFGSGIKWDAVEPALQINLDVRFAQTATWNATLFGKSISDPPPASQPSSIPQADGGRFLTAEEIADLARMK